MIALNIALLAGALVVVGSGSAGSSGPVPDDFTFAAGGDMIGPYHAFSTKDDPQFAVVAALFQHASLGFANQEGSIFDLAGFAGYPAAENGGGYPLQPAAAAAAIKAIGISLVSKANNHATDWGVVGLASTLQSLSNAGVVESGAGLSPEAARAPAYAATPRGLAALVDTASTFPPMALPEPAVTRAGVTSKPGPGISALHVRLVRLATDEDLVRLRSTAGPVGASEGGDLRIGDQLFRAAPESGTLWEMSPSDEDEILSSIKAARANARFVVFSIHAHETAGDNDVPPPSPYQPLVLHRANEAPSPNEPMPASFEPLLFHAAIEAGADAVVRTGPHSLNGIEIYKGRPIFYSLGSLFFDFGGRRSYRSPGGETLTFPTEWFESVVPVTRYRSGKISEIRLYPITIEPTIAARSGVPHPADHQASQRILQRLQKMSAPFSTKIIIEGDVGVIRGVG